MERFVESSVLDFNMRFLASENIEITQTLSKYYEKDRYVLIKRKGWDHIEIGPNTFAFHRKKTSILKDGKFMDKIQYRVRMKKNVRPVKGFPEVIFELNQWLQQPSH